ncbi:hypothetical protein [Streptomyces sp. DHE17-7]|uniref:hypothetical protein n=1 Tax=Streptomyces sp. DHE17-7 TaxID=2759949 RepID=UPI0022EA1A48|nr:hypothetical protein [Streptomyces sp. DHE17-7]MBJ6623622.1 hypothetical protein [Streptomyces sp. DHE17-7]
MKKRSKAPEAVGFALGFGLMIVAGLALSAYLVMLVVGMWHGHNPGVPALGFVDCLYAVAITGLLTGSTGAVTRN